MAMSEGKRRVCTAITLALVGIVTGLFLGGNLLPSQAAYQLYDKRVTTNTKVTINGHSHDDIPIHDHKITTTVTTTETTPHGNFHDFAPATTSQPAGTAPTPVQAANKVLILGRGFVPQITTVPVGTTVTWTNKAYDGHTITSFTGLFQRDISPNPGDNFSYTFTEPGEYNYYCEPHPDMFGTVIVK